MIIDQVLTETVVEAIVTRVLTRLTAPVFSRSLAELRTASARRGDLFWYRYGDSNPGPVAENHVS